MELILYISKDINIIERLVYITVKTYIKDIPKDVDTTREVFIFRILILFLKFIIVNIKEETLVEFIGDCNVDEIVNLVSDIKNLRMAYYYIIDISTFYINHYKKKISKDIDRSLINYLTKIDRKSKYIYGDYDSDVREFLLKLLVNYLSPINNKIIINEISLNMIDKLYDQADEIIICFTNIRNFGKDRFIDNNY